MNVLWAASLSIYKNLSLQLTSGVIVTLRFGLAALLLIPFLPFSLGKFPRGWDLLKTAVMGVTTFCIGHWLQVTGDKMGGAGNSSVLMGTEPVLTGILAALFLRERITLWAWGGFALGLLGVAILNGLFIGDFQWAGLAASGVFVSSFICEAVYSILGKKLIETSGMMKTLGAGLFFGTVANLLINGKDLVQAVPSLSMGSWLQVLYLAAICSALGYWIWFIVIQETDVNVTAMTIFVQPIAGVLIAALWLGEKLHIGQLWGCICIVCGILLGLRGDKKDSLPQPVGESQ